MAGRALGQAAANNHIFDLRWVDPRTLDGVSQDMRSHGYAMRVVEGAAHGLGDPGAAIANDGNILHASPMVTVSAILTSSAKERAPILRIAEPR